MSFNKLQFYVISFLSIGLFILVFINILPENPITKNERNIFQELAPQGFPFYSKSPRDETFTIEEVGEDSKKIKLPTSSPNNLFGIKRDGRAQAVEIGSLMERIPEGEWTTCQSNKECDDLKNDLSEYEFEEDSLFDFIEGTYIVTKAEPISWYWLEFEDTLSRDQQLVKVRVK
ncbi:SdpA family antimicrobial peptide system protein [Mammaliicoccus sciuri]|uniref:SdpA family antimicrobial peptide system protein n=1 Tax=Mammaliicoccus lentus TaxID=42858 RepID=A0AAX3W2W9_MAMLE|nr:MULTISPECIES: SdpA family antimicrobial peptide system protein [Mammaliicoccus]MCE5040784.1 SdpA family antimicrobial peptide system protein [Mammaliicoccus sciuri]WHI59705.1 SdpA family antimicrobial peptide system protein [Mammaliicoccus lentus]